MALYKTGVHGELLHNLGDLGRYLYQYIQDIIICQVALRILGQIGGGMTSDVGWITPSRSRLSDNGMMGKFLG